MREATVEDYLGAIYQLQLSQRNVPEGKFDWVPLSDLREQFGFTHISIHEMVQKLTSQGLVEYTPYQGVRLTISGQYRANALSIRHKVWERFLVEQLGILEDEAHAIAHQLEHAAPQKVTERLEAFISGLPVQGEQTPTRKDTP